MEDLRQLLHRPTEYTKENIDVDNGAERVKGKTTTTPPPITDNC